MTSIRADESMEVTADRADSADVRLGEADQGGTVWAAFRAGDAVQVGGNTPLLLCDPGAVWMVDTGPVHVFVVPLSMGVPAGTRTYLFSVEPGDLVLGPEEDPDTSNTALLIAGVPGSRVLRLPRNRLSSMLITPETAVEAETRLRKWIDSMGAAVRPELPPQQYARLQPGTDARLAAGDRGRPQDELVWFRLEDGHVTYWGRDQIAVLEEGAWMPLSSESWVITEQPSTLAVAATHQVVAEQEFWHALRAFHHAVLLSADLTAAADAKAETERLQRKKMSDQRALGQAFAELANEFNPALHASVTGGEEEDPLFAAARLVGDAAGIAIRRPPNSSSNQPGDRLFAIANASRIRTRKVALRGQWWLTESEPIVAHLAAGNAPVALIPNKLRGYLFVDPKDGSQTVVTPQVADTFNPYGHVLYRPLPEKRLGVVDLIRFAVRRTGIDFTTVLLMGAMGGALSLLTPIATGLLFDSIIPSAQRPQVLIIGLALIVSAVSSGLFQVTSGLALVRIESKMGAATQAGVWDRVLNLPVPFFHRFSAGDLQMRAMGIDAIRQILSAALASSILAAVFSVFSLALLFHYSVTLALLALIPIAFLIAITLALNYLQLQHQRQVMAYQGRLNGMLVQFITGIAKLRVAAAENRAFLVWARSFARQTHFTSKVRLLSVHLTAVQVITPVLTTMVLFAGVAYSISSLSTGNFLAFNSALGQFLAATLGLTGIFVSLLQIVPIFERSQAILDAEPEVSTAKVDPGLLSGDIDLNHVSFRYHPDGPLILDDISIRISPGEFVALVGPSGSGKSTIMRLLMGFEAPSSGAIYYDHQDLSDLDVRSLRRQIGVVLQHSQLMPGDIQTNILGNSGYTIEDAWEAARMAGFAGDISAMPMGMYTAVSEGISTLSGGQRQRLMIARALVSKPRVIFFDEATSALDNETQSAVSRSLEALQATRVVIAHRLSTIVRADTIYVVQNGRIVQIGSYSQLVVEDGPFHELAKRQLA